MWLASDLGLSVSQIGASTLVIVVAELAGEGLMITIADRLGLGRTVLGSLLLSAAAYGALGLMGHHLGVALVALGVLFVAFEVTVIALTALASTTRDAARGAEVLGSLMAVIACGNAVGAGVGPVLFGVGGIGLSGAASGLAVAGAVAFLWRTGAVSRATADRRPRSSEDVPADVLEPHPETTACPPAVGTAP